MTGATFAALTRYYTGKTTSVTFTDSEILTLANSYKDEIAMKIVERNAGYFLVPTPFDLVVNRREYGFPDDLLSRMHKLELKFSANDARFPSRYIKDYLGSETESEIVKNFGNAQGEFAHTIRRRAVFILSGTIPSVTSGGRIWYHAYPAAWTAANLADATNDLSIDPTTTTFGFPRQFHELLARRVSIGYKSSRPKPIPLSKFELQWDSDLEKALAAIARPDNSGEIIAENIPASDVGNNGYDY